MSRARRGPIRALLPTLRRLHGAELVHLRAHAARLEGEVSRIEAENEDLRREASWAADRTDMFADAMRQVADVELGLTRDGGMIVTPGAGRTR